MAKDIDTRQDIELLVNQFYEKVKVDTRIGFYFTKVMTVDWTKHLPIMYEFWENVLFHTDGYSGNPMQKHQAIHAKSAFNSNHFKQWTFLFNETVDELFSGVNAEKIKDRAQNISTVMQVKILKKE